jgi:hypothetical protein
METGPSRVFISLILFVSLLLPYSGLSADSREQQSAETQKHKESKEIQESRLWFRHPGDYLVFLTVQHASPRGFMLSVFSDTTAFETAIGKRLRIGSPSQNFHWGIEFGLFTSLERYGTWNFKNLVVDGRYGLFGLIDLKPTLLLIELAHYCSNYLQGAPEFAEPIRYSQYFIYGHVYFPTPIRSIPGLKFAKPYAGAGYYFTQYPDSYHIPFDFGIELETNGVMSSRHGLHIGFHTSYTGMRKLIPTHSLNLSWGTLTDARTASLPFTFGIFYQWGQDSRGQYYLNDRRIFGFRLNIVF